MKYIVPLLATALAYPVAVAVAVAAPATTGLPHVRNVVLVHGAFVDGSGWNAVARRLTADGYAVSIVQEPETSFADDVQATRRVLDLLDGPALLVGHSYGGAIITEAGNHPKVSGLVYIAALQPDTGEAPGALLQKMPAAGTGIKPTADGFLYIDPASFASDFAADLPVADAALMARSQVFVAAGALGQPITAAAWRAKPAWAMVATEDRSISPDLERFMYKRSKSHTVEVKASHAVYISQPDAVVNLIEAAATAGPAR